MSIQFPFYRSIHQKSHEGMTEPIDLGEVYPTIYPGLSNGIVRQNSSTDPKRQNEMSRASNQTTSIVKDDPPPSYNQLSY